MRAFTSFNEGISKTDKGAEDEIILALSSSSIANCDLEFPFCVSMDSRDGLKIYFLKNQNHFFLYNQYLQNTSSMAMDVPGRIRAG